MYALIGLFDNHLEQTIHKVWQGLSQLGLSQYAYEVDNREPHMTLASFDIEDPKLFIEQLQTTLTGQPPIDLTFNHLSSFVGMRIVTLNPIKTPALVDFHQNLHREFQFDQLEESLYNPEDWIPHITLANRIADENISKVYHYCLETLTPITSKMTSIKLIEIEECGKIKSLFEYFLS